MNRLTFFEVMLFPPKIFSLRYFCWSSQAAPVLFDLWIPTNLDGQLNGNTSLLKIDMFFLIIFAAIRIGPQIPRHQRPPLKEECRRNKKGNQFPKISLKIFLFILFHLNNSASSCAFCFSKTLKWLHFDHLYRRSLYAFFEEEKDRSQLQLASVASAFPFMTPNQEFESTFARFKDHYQNADFLRQLSINQTFNIFLAFIFQHKFKIVLTKEEKRNF